MPPLRTVAGMNGSRTGKAAQNPTRSGSAGRKKRAPIQLSWSSIKHDGSDTATSLDAWQPKGNIDPAVIDWAKAISWQTSATSAVTVKRTARCVARHGQHLRQQGVELDDLARVFSTLHVEDTISQVIAKLAPLGLYAPLELLRTRTLSRMICCKRP